MNPRMILLTTAAAASFAAAAQAAAAAPTDGRSAGSTCAAPARQHASAQISTRAQRLLHNPGLPAWIP